MSLKLSEPDWLNLGQRDRRGIWSSSTVKRIYFFEEEIIRDGREFRKREFLSKTQPLLKWIEGRWSVSTEYPFAICASTKISEKRERRIVERIVIKGGISFSSSNLLFLRHIRYLSSDASHSLPCCCSSPTRSLGWLIVIFLDDAKSSRLF